MEERLTKDQKKELRKQEWQKELQKEQKNKSMKKILIWVAVIIALVGGFWLINAATTYSPTSSSQANTALPPVSANDLAAGNKNAKVVLIEYADFQCPGCGAAYPVVKQIQKDFDGKILFVYRTFPLTQIHKNAMASSKIAVAANNQGKFWEMHDLLFANQTKWAELDDPTSVFMSYAKSLNLDIDKLNKDIADAKTQAFIDNTENAGTTAGVQGTPTFFLNKKQVNYTGYDGLKTLIEQELAKK